MFLFGFKQTGMTLRPVLESGEKLPWMGTLGSYLAVHEVHPHPIGSIGLDHFNGMKTRYFFIQTELLEFIVTEVSKHIYCSVLPQQQEGRSLQRTCGPCPWCSSFPSLPAASASSAEGTLATVMFIVALHISHEVLFTVTLPIKDSQHYWELSFACLMSDAAADHIYNSKHMQWRVINYTGNNTEEQETCQLEFLTAEAALWQARFIYYSSHWLFCSQ